LVLYDEQEYVSKMQENPYDYALCNLDDMKIYAKWLKYQKLQEIGKIYEEVLPEENAEIDKYVKNNLIEFCEKANEYFNYTLKYDDIRTAVAYTNLYKLKLPHKLPITRKEWEALQIIKDDNIKRLMFAMLIDSKYYRYFNISLINNAEVNEDTIFFIQADLTQLVKMSGAKFKTREEKYMSLHELYKLGLLDITDGTHENLFIRCVDLDDSDIIDYISDYDHIDLHYDKLCQKNVGVCEHCGKLFRQSQKNNRKYCYSCTKNVTGFPIQKKCIDCGNLFYAKSNRQSRCENCQELNRKKQKLNYIKAKRVEKRVL